MLGLSNPVHILFLLVLLLLVFGAKRLPEMGRSLGSGMRGFKESLSGEVNHMGEVAQPVQVAQPMQVAQSVENGQGPHNAQPVHNAQPSEEQVPVATVTGETHS